MAEKQELTKEQTQLLVRHWNTLKQTIQMDKIAEALIQASVITEREWVDIIKNYTSDPEKTEALLHKLLEKTPSDFNAFVDVFTSHGYEHLFERLSPGYHGMGNQRDDQRIQYLLRSVQQLKLNEKDFQRDKKIKDNQIKELMAARNDQEELKKKVENLESELKYLQEQLRKKETQISKLRAENKLVLNEKSELQKEMKIKEALHLSLEKENTFLKEKLEEQKSERESLITPRLLDPISRASTTLSGLIEEERQIKENIHLLKSKREAIHREMESYRKLDGECPPSKVCKIL